MRLLTTGVSAVSLEFANRIGGGWLCVHDACTFVSRWQYVVGSGEGTCNGRTNIARARCVDGHGDARGYSHLDRYTTMYLRHYLLCLLFEVSRPVGVLES